MSQFSELFSVIRVAGTSGIRTEKIAAHCRENVAAHAAPPINPTYGGFAMTDKYQIQGDNNKMAMITCPECGRQVPDTESHCPDCGHSLDSAQDSIWNNLTFWLPHRNGWGLTIAVILFFGYMTWSRFGAGLGLLVGCLMCAFAWVSSYKFNQPENRKEKNMPTTSITEKSFDEANK